MFFATRLLVLACVCAITVIAQPPPLGPLRLGTSCTPASIGKFKQCLPKVDSWIVDHRSLFFRSSSNGQGGASRSHSTKKLSFCLFIFRSADQPSGAPPTCGPTAEQRRPGSGYPCEYRLFFYLREALIHSNAPL